MIQYLRILKQKPIRKREVTFLALIFFILIPQIRAESLYVIPEGIEPRWASPENPNGEKGKGAQENNGRKGSAFFALKAGEARTLAEVSGASGMIRRIWITINDRTPKMLRGLKLDFYWDYATTPAISVPFGDFFGTGLGQTAAFESALFTNPEGKSFNCYVPMPFKKGMKIIVTNESDVDLKKFYYDVDYTIGDKHGNDVLYFHAYYHRENPTKLQQDYEILPKIEGKGRFLGTNISVIANQQRYYKSWWGEGEVKVYLDGDTKFPTLSGTGAEDYIGTGWTLGPYSHLYQGCPIVDKEKMRYCFYRYHILDPIYFQKDIRVTIQQIGWLTPKNKEAMEALQKDSRPLYRAGAGLVEIDKTNTEKTETFEREDDWSSCAYFYLDKSENHLPKLDPIAKRIEGL